MKIFITRIILCHLLLLVRVVFSQHSGWEIQESGTDAHLSDVVFIDAEKGWVVGNYVILNTTDGGNTWEIQDTSKVEFEAVSFADENHGWAIGYKEAGYHGVIYYTADGGENWQLQDSSSYYLHDIFCIDADTVFVVGGHRGYAAVLKTTDQGKHWDNFFNASINELYSIFFIDPKKGWASGQNCILRTEDGGKNWSYAYMDIGYTILMQIIFLNPDSGWAVGGSYIYKSIDAGKSWQTNSEKAFDHSFSCDFWDFNCGWIVGADKIIHTTDAGDHWLTQDSSLTTSLRAVDFIDDKMGWSVGTNGMIIATKNGGVTHVQTKDVLPAKFVLHQNYPNPFNPRTVIRYELPVTTTVELSIYNLLGQKIAVLVEGKQTAGKHAAAWTAAEFSGGLYFCILRTSQGVAQVRKMMLLK